MGDSLTVEKMLELAAALKPPREVFLASSYLLPDDRLVKFSDARRDYFAAGPAFWKTQPIVAHYARMDLKGRLALQFLGFSIHDLDAPGNEIRHRDFFRALAAAMISETERPPSTTKEKP